MSKAYFIYPSPIVNESRIFKEVASLKRYALVEKVVILGAKGEGLKELEHVFGGFGEINRFRLELELPMPERLCRILGFLFWIKAIFSYLKDNVTSADIVHCHSLSALSVSIKIARLVRCKVIYDAHELESQRAGFGFLRQWVSLKIEKKLVPQVDAFWVVGDLISDWYFGKLKIKPQVLFNYPRAISSSTPVSKKFDFRKQLNISNESLIFIYLGIISEGRGIQRLLQAFKKLEQHEHHIIFVGYGNLSQHVAEMGSANSNIHYLPAVPPDQVLEVAKAADVGVALIDPICLSYLYCLPNKLFEYLQAGLAILASDLPEIRRVVQRSSSGVLVKNSTETSSLISQIRDLSHANIKKFKNNASVAAKNFAWETQEEVIVQTYNNLHK